ncbi:MAG TPA: DUF2330 domain-containing protein [Polyangiales bacterium]|nr:DUF2330 domain-containing protein [Polyangiales bacterium]
MRACLGLLAGVVGCAAASMPLRAHACGGTFCDSGPQPVRVDQSGENVLFVRLDSEIEAHVQIRYQGDPARLAWLVPMPEVPDITVGSQPLFDALLADSAPVFGVRTTTMACDGTTETSESTGCGGGATSAPARGGVANENDQSGAMMDPIGKTVGSFDITILQPSDSEEVLQWIRDNDFQLPEQTQALIDPYVKGGSVIVAIRMAPGAGVQEIHPIVFRYPGTRASIPIQLTAVAATVDMRVRTFVLGPGRTVPSNYRSVEPNVARLNWPSFASNYESVVSAAVDETGDGLGFVTEYAGPSKAIVGGGVYDERWDSAPFLDMGPQEAVAELFRQGQITCQGAFCSFPHPLVLPLLQRYIPAPAGSDENGFYGCQLCDEDQIDFAAWDAEAFARDYRERIIEPAQHARELLQQQPYLTRLVTFMSPDEMIADPAFHLRSDLPNVDREHWAAQTIACDKAPTIELPDGREIVLGASLAWPGSDASVPSAERIEQIPETGKAQVVLDQGAEIDAALERINERNRRRVGGVSNLGSNGGTCRVSGSLAQQSFWIGAALLYLLRRRQRLH